LFLWRQAEVTEAHLEDHDFLKKLHHIMLEVRVVEGNLVCPESGRKFPISKGVPNMLLRADEL
jgi:multifunctional methyltransferase subunit TRM112